MQTAIRIQVSMHSDELASIAIERTRFRKNVSLHRTHRSPLESRAALGQTLNVTNERFKLTGTPDLNQVLTCPRNNASSQGLNDRIAILGSDAAHRGSFP